MNLNKLAQTEFSLDIIPGGIPPVVHASQGDIDRRFVANIKKNGAGYDVSDYDVIIRGKKPDGTVFEYEPDNVEDVGVVVSTTEQMTIVPGPVACELVFSQGGTTVATANFVLKVEGAPYDPDALSESDVQTLGDLIEQTIGGDIRDEVQDYIEQNPDALLQDNSVTTPKIVNGAVTPEKIDNKKLSFHMVNGRTQTESSGRFGNCTVVTGEVNGFIDFGNDSSGADIISYLQSANVTKIDFAIITHYHGDHTTQNFTTLLQNLIAEGIDFADCVFYLPHKGIDYSAGNFEASVPTNEQSVKSALSANNIPYIEPNDGQTVNLTDALEISFFNIGATYYAQYYNYYVNEAGTLSAQTIYNNFSMITVFKHYSNTFVFPGDIHEPAQKANAKNIEACDVYAVEHHALNRSTDSGWLYCINPRFAMIGNYSDNYDDEQLTYETVSKLANAGCMIMSTADGAITISSDFFGVSCEEGTPYKTRHLQSGSYYYEGEILTKEHFPDSVKTGGLIDLDKLTIPGKYFSPNADFSAANISPITAFGYNLTGTNFQVEVTRLTQNKSAVCQCVKIALGAIRFGFRFLNSDGTTWGDWIALDRRFFDEYTAFEDLSTFTAPTVYSNRVEYVAGGYKTIGAKTFVDVIVKTVSTYSFGAGTYAVMTGLPHAKDYLAPLQIAAVTGDANTSKFVSANVGTNGSLNILTNAALGTPSTITTVRMRGWYYHS